MRFIVHDDPVLRADSNYIAQIALAPFGFDDEVEQVWLRRTADASATLCCIPFRAYGVALGDSVRLHRHRGASPLRTPRAARAGRR
ncbi:hypothetical protein [Kribbella sp. NPDC050459]|uniref:DUF4265 domain-containing protein n=1 Tax=Kribbella sp. NPDC050459 TaxID=3155785 RepID=UPI0033FF4B2D